ncbi:MAG: hypothetical protein OQK82_04065 [Candidatus Pacearchaeota archaeon]|nr:hypothetical protein [Candidatus Pacearchaeota archaeon]
MKKYRLNEMARGWFVGDFEPSAFKTKDCEVALQQFKEGDYEQKHIHKVATELTLIVKGKALMNRQECNEGDIIVLDKGESTDFKALTDVTNIVVKVPCAKGDKYIID